MTIFFRLAMLSALILTFPSSDSDDTQFQLGPNNERCILPSDNIHDASYEHMDKYGHQCKCQLCRFGQRLVDNCTCIPGVEDHQRSECTVVDGGQFMNASNKCSRGFECKQCLYPLKVEKPCEAHGPDTVCVCVDGYHMVDRDVCSPDPRCDTGSEPISGYGEHGSEIRCIPCHPGFFQPENNSTSKCRKIRNCTMQEATLRSDAVCLNDDPLQLERPTEGAAVTVKLEDSTETDQEITMKEDSSTNKGTESRTTYTPSTTSSPDKPSGHGCPPRGETVMYITHDIVFLLLGIAVCNVNRITNFFLSFFQRGSYVLPSEVIPLNHAGNTDMGENVVQQDCQKVSFV